MDTKGYEQKQTPLQVATRDWILCGEPNAFVTLTFRSEDRMSYQGAVRIFGTFAHQLKCELFGEKSKKRIFMVPIIEGYAGEQSQTVLTAQREETHIHCLFCFPENPMDYMDVVRRTWVASSGACGNPDVYCPNSDEWFLELDTVERKRIFTNYVLKTCGQDSEAVLWKFVSFGTRLKG